jgi:SAM-dependent methyltransferase
MFFNRKTRFSCAVCGGSESRFKEIISKDLANQWQLSPEELDYVNRQQGQSCVNCGSNLRSLALAEALRKLLGLDLPLREVKSALAARDQRFSLLEINEAGSLSSYLKELPGYAFGSYPQVDMHNLPFEDGTFDILVHSDTLEHIANPIHALAECLRVLRPGGSLLFTVPVIVARLSRDRSGLENSYHGRPKQKLEDYKVYTEFGADAWVLPLRAGFQSVEMSAVEFPAAIAMRATK